MSSTPEGQTFPTRHELLKKARDLERRALKEPYTEAHARKIRLHAVRPLSDPHAIIFPQVAHLIDQTLSLTEIDIAMLHSSRGKSVNMPHVPVVGDVEPIDRIVR